MTTPYTLFRTSGPSAEPVSLAEARDQCEIAANVTAHDTKLTRYIAAAREQVESDTAYVCLSQTYTVSLHAFPAEDDMSIYLPVRPVQSISSITYYDTNNDQQVLSTSVYGLDQSRRRVFLKYDQEWPSIAEQWNGIVITLVAGYGSSEVNVPRLIKQAILLQVMLSFYDRGELMNRDYYRSAYEATIRKILRTSYP